MSDFHLNRRKFYSQKQFKFDVAEHDFVLN